jgi:hypothetical protein
MQDFISESIKTKVNEKKAKIVEAQHKIGLMWLQHEMSGNKDPAAKAYLMDESQRQYESAAQTTSFNFYPDQGKSEAYLKERKELREELEELFSENRSYSSKIAPVLKRYAKLNKRNNIIFDPELHIYEIKLSKMEEEMRENIASFCNRKPSIQDVFQKASVSAINTRIEALESERRAAEFAGDIDEIRRLTKKIGYLRG